MSKGLIILLFGVFLSISTLIWINKDNATKNKRQEELLEKINKSSSNIRTNSTSLKTIKSEDDTTEWLEDSTELLEDSTELLNDTEQI